MVHTWQRGERLPSSLTLLIKKEGETPISVLMYVKCSAHALSVKPHSTIWDISFWIWSKWGSERWNHMPLFIHAVYNLVSIWSRPPLQKTHALPKCNASLLPFFIPQRLSPAYDFLPILTRPVPVIYFGWHYDHHIQDLFSPQCVPPSLEVGHHP